MLPQVNYALSKLHIPSTNQEIVVRPMTARDEKILLMAKASTGPETNQDIMLAVQQVVNGCIVTPGIDIQKLSLFDLDWLFIRLRALSVSNVIRVAYADNEEVAKWQEDVKADPKLPAPAPYNFDIPLDKVEIKFPENRNMEIDVGDSIKLTMKYPDSSLFTNKDFLAATGENVLDYILKNCIKTIKQGDTVFDPAESSPEEVKEFIDNLPLMTYEKIKEFIANLPTIFYELKYENRLGKERRIVLTNLQDFFRF